MPPTEEGSLINLIWAIAKRNFKSLHYLSFLNRILEKWQMVFRIRPFHLGDQGKFSRGLNDLKGKLDEQTRWIEW